MTNYNINYAGKLGDILHGEPRFDENGYPISESQAREFWRDLMGTLWGDANCKVTHGIMSAELVADHMRISAEKANAFMWTCVDLGLSDRQGGAFVV